MTPHPWVRLTGLAFLAWAGLGCHSVPKGYGDACLWNGDCPDDLHCSSYLGGRCTADCTWIYTGMPDDCPGTHCREDSGSFCLGSLGECSLSCVKELGGCDDEGNCIDE